jgi:outer membrane lipoprotein LolB|tara:strand:+ start:230 stop:868 length:639 start_codon:yes stop_codon:yes gene_type:complete
MKFAVITQRLAGIFVAKRTLTLRCLSLRGIYLSFLILLFSACASLPTNHSSVTAETYAVSGKLIIIQPEQRSSAGFRWSQQAENFQMELWGPLGVGRTLIAGSATYAELTQGAQIIDQGQPSQIMRRQLGWSAPIDVFPYWIKGVVAPNVAVETVEKDAQGRLLRFTQAGWSVSYADHIQGALGEQRELPGRITIEGRDLQLKIIIGRKSAK